MASRSRLSVKVKAILRVLVCTVVAGLPCLLWFQELGGFQFITQASLQERFRQLMEGDGNLLRTKGSDASDLPLLRQVLKSASTPDNTVIITTLNEAWAVPSSMIDLFLYSFQQGENISRLVNNLVIVTLDQYSHERCVEVHQHCFRLITEGVDFSRGKEFMSVDYLKMMWRRIEFLQSVLELGYNFLFTDADIMWFRDPFPRLHPHADIQIACDKYLGGPTNLGNKPNGGFLFARSNEKTVELYKYWYRSRLAHPDMHDQDVFDKIKGDAMYRQIGVQAVFLETRYFAGFCEVSKDFENVCTMHANCCKGLDNKLADLRLVLEDWKRFKDLSYLQRRMQGVHWNAPKSCKHSLRK